MDESDSNEFVVKPNSCEATQRTFSGKLRLALEGKGQTLVALRAHSFFRGPANALGEEQIPRSLLNVPSTGQQDLVTAEIHPFMSVEMHSDMK